MYHNPWTYQNQPFSIDDCPEEVLGFIYIVTHKESGMKYVGKKQIRTLRKLPPLKGQKRKRKKIVETDWKKYYGSSERVCDIIKEEGAMSFSREIIKLCKTKAELGYFEMKYQIENDVLIKPNEYYNAFVGGKIHRNHLKHLFTE
jgi:hypothetical protein